MRLLRPAAAASLVVGLLASPASAQSPTVYVGQCAGPSPYSTVQSAVDAATTPGTVVSVCPGTYREQVRIVDRSRLTVAGQAGAVIDASQLIGPALTATGSPRLTVSGLILRSATSGAEITSSRGARLQGLWIYAGGDGVIVVGSPGSRVVDNLVRHDRNVGVLVSRSDGSQVTKNEVDGGGTGVAVYETKSLRVVGNSIAGQDLDARDTTSGTGTAGTASTWLRNRCDTSVPAGLCVAPGA